MPEYKSTLTYKDPYRLQGYYHLPIGTEFVVINDTAVNLRDVCSRVIFDRYRNQDIQVGDELWTVYVRVPSYKERMELIQRDRIAKTYPASVKTLDELAAEWS